MLAKPDLTDDEFEVLEEAAGVEREARDGEGASIYRIGESGEMYHALSYDEMGLAARVGDYNAEWLGREVAVEIATAHFRLDEDYDGPVATVVSRVSKADSTREEIRGQRDVFYRVAVLQSDGE